ncbi:MAG: hypothetical protein HOD63_05890 [Bacteroidetes bacterium]|jgi:hypothetical protein|nr:hypothetical protein [Bacteroidota bacterium]MBT5528459.1 hypothetical protein [Cytophagia bacterium]MBT3801079.1 hypothetical protein [Bacteroidota bacterium]MBT3933755.1 hypothetical protein [Bacteroidota bacterium]MBT4338100.1 hypothetical protein [Bacteroidota bacterium]
MKKFALIMCLISVISYSFAQSSGTETASNPLCESIDKVIAGFDNSFYGMYTTEGVEKRIDDFNFTIYDYKAVYILTGFTAGNYKKHEMSSSSKWTIYFSFSGTEDDVNTLWGQVEECMKQGWTYIDGAADYGYFGYASVTYYEKGEYELTIDASTGDDNFIAIEIAKM